MTPMMKDRRRRARDERGAVLVHVAVAMLALMAFSALAIDYGALWVSRRQAQNSADAAALAGALSLAFDDPDDVARAQAAAAAAGTANQVWGAAPSILPATDVQLVPCPPGAPGLPDTCIRANVYRSTARLNRSNALPAFFAQIFGITSQDVRATATAQVLIANAVECLKPWAVADKWGERWEAGASNSEWTPTSKFDKWKWQSGGWVHDPAVPEASWDFYDPPTATGPGTGFTPFDASGKPTAEYGLELTLRSGLPSGSDPRLSSGWFQALSLVNPNCNGSSMGVDCYTENIANCNPNVFGIGDSIPVFPGAYPIPTQHAVDGPLPGSGLSLMEKDPNAYWDEATKSIQGSCAPGICNGQYYAKSPRIVPVPLFDVDAYLESQLTNPTPGSNASITITNIMGFFIVSATGGEVRGRLVAIPGVTKGTTSVVESAAFLRHVMLVR
jgi:Putative Flp pilus-assembly TadE/G-like